MRVCEEYIRASSPAHFISIEDIGHHHVFILFVVIQVIATSGGQSESDERNQQVMMIHEVSIKDATNFVLDLLTE